MTTATRSQILSQPDIQRRLHRMAIEVAERNTAETALVVAGIEGNGMVVARRLIDELQQIMPLQLTLVSVRLDKRNPIAVGLEPGLDCTGKVVLVVDDVADSGRTLLYALKPFLEMQPRSIQTLVLVERSHKVFPVTTDFVGLSLSTTLQEHIRVEVDGEQITGAFLQ